MSSNNDYYIEYKPQKRIRETNSYKEQFLTKKINKINTNNINNNNSAYSNSIKDGVSINSNITAKTFNAPEKCHLIKNYNSKNKYDSKNKSKPKKSQEKEKLQKNFSNSQNVNNIFGKNNRFVESSNNKSDYNYLSSANYNNNFYKINIDKDKMDIKDLGCAKQYIEDIESPAKNEFYGAIYENTNSNINKNLINNNLNEEDIIKDSDINVLSPQTDSKKINIINQYSNNNFNNENDFNIDIYNSKNINASPIKPENNQILQSNDNNQIFYDINISSDKSNDNNNQFIIIENKTNSSNINYNNNINYNLNEHEITLNGQVINNNILNDNIPKIQNNYIKNNSCNINRNMKMNMNFNSNNTNIEQLKPNLINCKNQNEKNANNLLEDLTENFNNYEANTDLYEDLEEKLQKLYSKIHPNHKNNISPKKNQTDFSETLNNQNKLIQNYTNSNKITYINLKRYQKKSSPKIQNSINILSNNISDITDINKNIDIFKKKKSELLNFNVVYPTEVEYSKKNLSKINNLKEDLKNNDSNKRAINYLLQKQNDPNLKNILFELQSTMDKLQINNSFDCYENKKKILNMSTLPANYLSPMDLFKWKKNENNLVIRNNKSDFFEVDYINYNQVNKKINKTKFKDKFKEFNEIINNRNKNNENKKVNNGTRNELNNCIGKCRSNSGLSPISELLDFKKENILDYFNEYKNK